MNIPKAGHTYKVLCKRIERREPVTFTRFGDGEWNAIFGKEGHNGDKHQYFKGMGERLREIVQNKREGNYFYGLQPLSNNKFENKIRKVSDSSIEWHNADCLAIASINQKVDRYFNAIKRSKLMMVAPGYLRNFGGYDEFVEVPTVDCWLQKDEIVEEVKRKLSNEYTVVSVVASMAANVIVDELYQVYGDTHTFIDAGSVYDPYVGVITRKYHNNIIKRIRNN